MPERKEHRRWLTPGTVLGGLAVVVASIQPAQAVAERLGAGSVGTRELKAGAVTAPKLHANAVTGAKVVNGSLTVADLAASARPRLPRSYAVSDLGFFGSSTNSYVTLASIPLPAGTWAVTAKVGTSLFGAGSQTGCILTDGATRDSSVVSLANAGTESDTLVTLVARPTYAARTTLALRCFGVSSTLGDIGMLATEVG